MDILKTLVEEYSRADVERLVEEDFKARCGALHKDARILVDLSGDGTARVTCSSPADREILAVGETPDAAATAYVKSLGGVVDGEWEEIEAAPHRGFTWGRRAGTSLGSIKVAGREIAGGFVVTWAK